MGKSQRVEGTEILCVKEQLQKKTQREREIPRKIVLNKRKLTFEKCFLYCFRIGCVVQVSIYEHGCVEKSESSDKTCSLHTATSVAINAAVAIGAVAWLHYICYVRCDRMETHRQCVGPIHRKNAECCRLLPVFMELVCDVFLSDNNFIIFLNERM